MAVEIANFIKAYAVFSAANPPVLYASNGVSAVARGGAGIYTLTLDEKAADPSALDFQQGCLSGVIGGPAGPTFAGITAAGDVQATTTDFAGAAADTGGVVFVLVTQFPTVEG